MIFRQTETFRNAFLKLNVDQQAEVLLALSQFREMPRMPSPNAQVVEDTDPASTDDDIWHLPVSRCGHITYSYLANAHASHVVCALRCVGFD